MSGIVEPPAPPAVLAGAITNSTSVATDSLLRGVFERSCSGLSMPHQKQLWELLERHRHAFATSPYDLGKTHLVQHKVDTGAAQPIRQRPRRLPFARRTAADRCLMEMRQAGVIEASESPWSSPVVMVPKPDGSWRFCVDYRQLNDVTTKDSYPIPRIDESLDRTGGSKWFSSLDLRSGYWQVAMDTEAKAKTAFSTGEGLWQFTTMPFGLCNAPATFERLMERVLRDIPKEECLVYLDDVLVHGADFDAALKSLDVVIKRITEAGLKLHPDKCKFMQREITFLGHQLNGKGVAPTDHKVAAVKNWPVPCNLRQLRAFIGLASYYRRFIRGFSTVAAPLHYLSNKGVRFHWGQEQQQAFDALKTALCNPPVLHVPQPDCQFVLDTDASNVALGAVLSQITPEGERVVGYYSRAFERAEKNYCVTRRELLAVVDSVRHFRYHLCGLPFVIRTDHASLRWLLSFREPEGQVARWIEKLEAYQFKIIHRNGEAHQNADGLSRRLCPPGCPQCGRLQRPEGDVSDEPGEVICRAALPDTAVSWAEEQRKDPELKEVICWLEAGQRPDWAKVAASGPMVRALWSMSDGVELQDGVLRRRWIEPSTGEHQWQTVVPKECRQDVLDALHGQAGVGHFGVKKTLKRVREVFYWNTCRRDVETYCRQCDACTARKGPPGRSQAPLQQYRVGWPMDRVGVDVLGPFPRTPRGNRFVVVALDYFTKWPEAFATPDQEAETVCDGLLQGMFARFGIPSELHSDQGRNFESRLFTEFCRQLGIRKTRTTPLHPQSDGLVERFNRTLGVQLALCVEKDQRDWDLKLPLVLLACRSAVQETTGCTPALLMLGRELRTPPALLFGQPPDAPDAPPGLEYAHLLQDRMETAHAFARRQAVEAGERQRRAYDLKAKGRDFAAGELVWVYGPKRRKGRSPKLDSKWVGPCYVAEKVGEVVYRVRMSPGGRHVVLHRDRLAPYLGRSRPNFSPATSRRSPSDQQSGATREVTSPAPMVTPGQQTHRRLVDCPEDPQQGPDQIGTPIVPSPLTTSSTPRHPPSPLQTPAVRRPTSLQTSRRRRSLRVEDLPTTPLGVVLPQAIADLQTQRRERPQRKIRPPQRFRDFILGDEETKGGAV